MNRIQVLKLTSLVVMSMFSASALSGQEPELQKGFGPDRDPHGYFRFLAIEHNRYPESLVPSVDGDRVYSLGRNSIGAYKVIEQGLTPLGGWPLTRWPHEYLEPEILNAYDYGSIRFSMPGDPDVYLADELKLLHLMGCMPKTPLRHGDVTGDGHAELVVFLSDDVSTDMRLFSLEKGRVIFSTKLHFFDSENRDVITDDYPDDATFQYLSRRDISLGESLGPALRGFAKIYVGDFSNDEQPDLLLWRKLYRSHELEDEIQGFEHLRDTLIHYTLIDGEYQPQETEADVIQGWLAENELTWQKGYPSKSECEGEEGELIPEMHDPLLNDPDVLK